LSPSWSPGWAVLHWPHSTEPWPTPSMPSARSVGTIRAVGGSQHRPNRLLCLGFGWVCGAGSNDLTGAGPVPEAVLTLACPIDLEYARHYVPPRVTSCRLNDLGSAQLRLPHGWVRLTATVIISTPTVGQRHGARERAIGGRSYDVAKGGSSGATAATLRFAPTASPAPVGLGLSSDVGGRTVTGLRTVPRSAASPSPVSGSNLADEEGDGSLQSIVGHALRFRTNGVALPDSGCSTRTGLPRSTRPGA
jgi:hypothetical protein